MVTCFDPAEERHACAQREAAGRDDDPAEHRRSKCTPRHGADALSHNKNPSHRKLLR